MFYIYIYIYTWKYMCIAHIYMGVLCCFALLFNKVSRKLSFIIMHPTSTIFVVYKLYIHVYTHVIHVHTCMYTCNSCPHSPSVLCTRPAIDMYIFKYSPEYSNFTPAANAISTALYFSTCSVIYTCQGYPVAHTCSCDGNHVVAVLHTHAGLTSMCILE